MATPGLACLKIALHTGAGRVQRAGALSFSYKAVWILHQVMRDPFLCTVLQDSYNNYMHVLTIAFLLQDHGLLIKEWTL